LFKGFEESNSKLKVTEDEEQHAYLELAG